MFRSLWSRPGSTRLIAGAAVACAGLAAVVWHAPAGHADATSPTCPTPVIDSGTLTPPMPGKLVNAGATSATITGRTDGACGWAASSTLHLWSPDPTWFQASTLATLGDHPADTSRVTVTKTEASGATTTTYQATVPASGETWVGVRYRIPDDAPELGFGVNQSALLPTRLVVRTPPKINPPPPVLAHDNSDTPLSGTAWPGDAVTVTDQNGNTVCTAVAAADGTWNCTADRTFPNGTTSLTVSEHGVGARNPEYPGLSSAGLPDLSGNTVRTAVITADPAVTKELDDATPRLGDIVTYTITATNNGPNTAVSASVADALPAGVEYISSTTTVGTFDAATGAWTGIGDLAKNERQTLTIKARVTDRGTIINPARISATAATDGVNTSRLRGADGVPDWNLNTANDADSAALETVPSADPQITKQVDRRAHSIGDTVVYTIVAKNNGPDEATGTYVSDPLPDGLEFVSATPSVGTYDEAADRWTIGTLPTTLTLRAKVTQAGTIRNEARISAAQARSRGVSGTDPKDANTDLTNDLDAAVIVVPNEQGTVPASGGSGGARVTGGGSGSSQPGWAGNPDNMESLPVTGAPASVVALLGLGAVLAGLAVIFGARYAYRRRVA